MSISQSLTNALSGLTANARMAEVVSSNLSNALTDGYGRRSVELSAQTIGGSSAGVKVDGIQRHVDRGLMSERRLADAGMASADRTAATLTKVEAAFSPPDDPSGLGGRLVALETAMNAAAADPASDQRLGLVLTRLNEVTTTLSQAARTVQSLRQQADADVGRDVATLNASLQQVERLNADISRMGTLGQDPSALMDQRQQVIDRIGTIVPIREVQQPQGKVALWTTSGAQLLDGKAAQIGFATTPTITADMTLASGGLQGLTLNGLSAGPNGLGRLAGGSLGASLALRDDQLVTAQTGLDQVAADLITRFADPAVDPTLAAGDPGLLTDRGAAHDPADIVGLSQRISVNASVDPGRGGALSRLRDGVQATAAGAIGQSAQLNRFSDALQAQRSIDPAIVSGSALGQVSRVADLFATARLNGEQAQGFAAARHDSLKAAELATGVDSDAELQTLLRVEQAYAANAKVLDTIQSLIQRLMEI
ncbi:flagellar hook-associated protein FlgK [Loktanella sp. M215]|uniref:flagellar hook-associated protein FlgK n=1 Tax=Loktanella sp. M215 TaxID=2675431 RepID=UPI001F27807E|nr:flagellar hook-associated protein FlgK [Loktanella sp. M215]MCF7698825.1 flagellar hook-associated protein FlgK [Loktanella sp. M215]